MRALGYDVDDSPPAGRAAWDRIRDLSWDGLRRLRKLRDAMVGLRRGEA
jgi:hypothetical protein